jgi:hypothetical protein
VIEPGRRPAGRCRSPTRATGASSTPAPTRACPGGGEAADHGRPGGAGAGGHGQLQAARLALLPAALLGRADPDRLGERGGLPAAGGCARPDFPREPVTFTRRARHPVRAAAARGRPAARAAAGGPVVPAERNRREPARQRRPTGSTSGSTSRPARRARRARGPGRAPGCGPGARPTRCRSGRAPAGITCASPTRTTTGARLARGAARWGGPDLYVGGAEHAVLHLLYARFWHKVLFDLGPCPKDEPFRKLFHQGIILGEDGEKMSRAAATSSIPTRSSRATAPTRLRLYLMFLGPLEAMKPWNPRGIEGVHRFLQKVWRDCVGEDGAANPKDRRRRGRTRRAQAPARDDPQGRRRHRGLRFNTAISQMMIFRERLHKEPGSAARPRSPSCRSWRRSRPIFAEEVWSRLGAPGTPAPRRGPSLRPGADLRRRGPPRLPGQRETPGRPAGPVGLAQDQAVELAKAHERVAPFLAGRSIVKVVYVPNRILNLVVADQISPNPPPGHWRDVVPDNGCKRPDAEEEPYQQDSTSPTW